jgi:DHA3 family macrolide efflux protein-like MFS transporter
MLANQLKENNRMTETTIPAEEKKPGLKDLLTIRDFRYLWTGQVISNFGDSMTSLALLLMVNELTGSTAALATLSILLAVPSLTFGLVAGVFVDRIDRRKIMIVSDLLRAFFVLAFVMVDSVEHLWVLYLVSFIQASIGTFFNPARSAIVPNVVPKDSLMAANSVSQSSRIIFTVLGTAAAGWLVGTLDSYASVFIVDSATFLVSMALIIGIRYRPEVKVVGEKINIKEVFSQLVAGLKTTFSTPILRGVILGIAVAMLGLGAVNILLVPLLVNEMQVPETWFAALELSQTASMVLSGGLFAALAARFKPQNIFASGLVGLGFGVALVALAGNVWHIMLILFLIGWFMTPVQAAGMTIIQTAVPDELRGRTSAANNSLITVANLVSMAAAGVLAESIGIRSVFVLGGGVVVLAGLLSAMSVRQGLSGIVITSPTPAED